MNIKNTIKSIISKFKKHISNRQIAYLGLLTFIVKNPWTLLSATAAAWTGYKLFTTGTYIQSWFSFSAWKDWIWNNSRPTIFDAKEVTSAARQAAQQAIDVASQVHQTVSESAQGVVNQIDDIVVETEQTIGDLGIGQIAEVEYLQNVDYPIYSPTPFEESRNTILSEGGAEVFVYVDTDTFPGGNVYDVSCRDLEGKPEHEAYLIRINNLITRVATMKDLPSEVIELLNELTSVRAITIEDMVEDLCQKKFYLEAGSTGEERFRRYKDILIADAKSDAKSTFTLYTAFGISAFVVGKSIAHYLKS